MKIQKIKSIFLSILKEQGINLNNSPVVQALRRVSVGAIMSRQFATANRSLTLLDAQTLLRQEPKCILIHNSEGRPSSLLPTVDLAHYLEEQLLILEQQELSDTDINSVIIDLFEIPAQRKDLSSLYFQATLQEALDRFAETKTDILFVERASGAHISRVLGVLYRSDVENYYQYKRK